MTEISVIQPARFPPDRASVAMLFREYAAGLNVDLSFQGFDAELADLPGKYAPPAGQLLLAWKAGEAVGCVGLRALADATCEMKRLYVRPSARGEQWGRRLVQAVCQQARESGYRRMCLDTLASMQSAQALYRSIGFREIDAYGFNPLPGTKYLALELFP